MKKKKKEDAEKRGVSCGMMTIAMSEAYSSGGPIWEVEEN